MSQKLSPITRKNMEKRMNNLLQRLGLSFCVQWQADQTREKHAKIDLAKRLIYIYDVDLEEGWLSLLHEIVELRLRPVLNFNRRLLNMLIEFVERESYDKKERFLEGLPKVFAEYALAKDEIVPRVAQARMVHRCPDEKARITSGNGGVGPTLAKLKKKLQHKEPEKE